MENYDIVDKYQQCIHALDYYREVAKSIGTLLQLSRNTDGKKNNDSLALSQTILSDRSSKLLNNRDRNGQILSFDHEQVLRWRANQISADKSREDELMALRGIISMLEAARQHLLYHMSTRQVTKLIKKINLTALQDVREGLKVDIGNSQYSKKLLEEERVKKGTITKEEMAAQFMEIHGINDEEFNEVHSGLGEELKQQSVQSIELGWNMHLNRLKSLSKSIVMISRRLERLISIEKVVNLYCSEKQSASISTLLLTGGGGRAVQELESATGEAMHDAVQISAEEVIESDSAESATSVSHEPEAGAVNTDATHDSDSTQTTSVEAELIDRGSEPPIQASRFLPEVTLEEYGGCLGSSFTNAYNIPPLSHRMFKENEKEYDFNLKNQSRSRSTRAATKESHVNAFAGLDTYARDLFLGGASS